MPPASSTLTTAVKAVAAVPLEGGSVVKASLEAAPALIVIPVLVALVSPLVAAVSVYVPVVFMSKLEKVAMPLTAETVVVPVTPEAVEVIVTEAVEEVTRLPPASSTCTTAVKAVAAVPLEGGSVVKTSLEAGPELIVMLLLVALATPEEAAVSVYVPRVFRIKLEKVATPPTAETVVVPATPEAVEVIDTEAEEVVTTLPYVS